MTDERARMLEISGDYRAGDGGWLADYVDYARSVTDAPLAFHVGAGLTTLAGAVGSRPYFRGGGNRETWPNLYTLLLAPSGIFRKSTSVDIGGDLLARALPGRILDREFSPERFLANLADSPTALLKEAEFSSLLERMKASYMGGMKQRLTELYDCMPEYGRKIQGGEGKPGHILIQRPALSILAASTMDWLVESLTEMDMRSGFMPRFLFFPATQKEPEPLGGYWAQADPAREQGLTRGLRQLGSMARAEVRFDDVRRDLRLWTDSHTARVETGTLPDELSGLYSRLGHHLSKLCALLQVSNVGRAATYSVHPTTAERAIALLEWIIVGTERVFDERIVFSKFERLAQQCLRWIGDDVDRSTLLKRMRITARELDQLLGTLRERGEIEEYTRTGTTNTTRRIRRLHPGKDSEELGKIREGFGKDSPNGRASGKDWERLGNDSGTIHQRGGAQAAGMEDLPAP